jgi:peptide/nickel transport system permease protein
MDEVELRPQAGGISKRTPWRHVLGNIPLLIGSVILLGLFLTTLFGPQFAPQNPYLASQPIVTHYDARLKVLIEPPLPPSAEYPLGTDRWGVDLLSLLLHGARNTLVACLFITTSRVLLGVILGGLAGWNEGRLSDQIVMGAIGVISSVPLLISSMFLIYSLDIRRGLPVFIVALSMVGWTEIAQYIRGEFLVIRSLPFIDGARTVGLHNLAIAVRHVLPNLLSHLLIVSFLEMGAVMMLMGELGFIGVFIGGGSRISIEVALEVREVFRLIEVPEWGAMLAEGFNFLRSKPFVVFPPAVAFFISVLGFNTFGEGLRRHIEMFGLNTAILLRKRMLLILLLITASTVYIIQRTGPAPWFSKVAQSFGGDRAYNEAIALSSMSGRGHGQPGGEQAVDYIANRFEQYGLQPGWKHNSYIYPLEAHLVRPNTQPEMILLSGDGLEQRTFKHQDDFAYLIDGHGGSGSIQGALTFVGFDNQASPSAQQYQGLDLSGRIVLLQEGNAPSDFPTEALIRGAMGVVWIAADEEPLLYSEMLHIGNDHEYLRNPQMPIFKIQPSVAQALVAIDELTIADLFYFEDGGNQLDEGWFSRDLSAQLHMSLELLPEVPHVVNNIIGYLPGSDFDHAQELVVLFASYDGAGVDPDGTIFPGANHNASGIATLLELARHWQEESLDPRRPVLLVAWGTEVLGNKGIQDYFGERLNFQHLLSANSNRRVHPFVIFHLDSVGAGEEALKVSEHIPARYLRLLKVSADEVEIKVLVSTDESSSIQDDEGTNIPIVQLGWAQDVSQSQEDTSDSLTTDRFQDFGETLTFMMVKLLRSMEY